MSALASLNADYSDSEDELEEGHRKRKSLEGELQGEAKEEEEEEGDDASEQPAAANPALDRLKEAPSRGGSSSQGRTPSSVSGSAKSTPTKVTRLVSYAEEGGDEDEEEPSSDRGQEPAEGEAEVTEEVKEAKEEDEDGTVPMDLESESSQDGAAKEEPPDEDKAGDQKADLDTSRGVEVEAWTGGVTLPPEPKGACNPTVQEFFAKQWRRKQEDPNFDINRSMQDNKKFRNPSIYEKLIEYCNIDEHGTNFPKELYDGHLFGKESYYEELDKVQAAEMKRREKAAEKRKAEATGAADSGAKRKSKWDQSGGGPPPAVIMGGSANAASKTISAFGPLKK